MKSPLVHRPHLDRRWAGRLDHQCGDQRLSTAIRSRSRRSSPRSTKRATGGERAAAEIYLGVTKEKITVDELVA
jgi:hypothetical protein